MRHAREDYARIQDPAGLIPEDEPVFLLRGRDRVAHLAVLFWAVQAEASGASPAITEKARAQAEAMKAWAWKLPDLPGDPVEHVDPPSSGNADDFVHTVESSRAWMAHAAGYARDVDFYRGLVVQIGEMLGKAAYTADDGSISEDVLCIKVPELVRMALRPAPMIEIPVDAASGQLFRTLPVVVEAYQVTRENGESVARWCDAQFLSLYGRGDRGEDISHVAIRAVEGYNRAYLGEWIVKNLDHGFSTYTAEAFAKCFVPADLPTPAPALAPPTDAASLLASFTPDEIVKTAQQLEILCARDPRHGPIYSELAISLRGIAERRRQS